MSELKKEFLLEANKVILGKEKELVLALCAFISKGHILIEDIPGVGKTTFAKTIAKCFGLNFNRIQFTSDLLPSDVIGAQIYNQRDHTFTIFKGPIFNQFVLADELNRANPKTQSAMLEAMEEHQVTIDRESYELPDPFFVVATQNPRTQIGTHLLPESQLDRFMIRLSLGFPTKEEEKNLLLGHDTKEKFGLINNIFNKHDLLKIQNSVRQIKLSDKVLEYVLNLIDYSRKNPKLSSLSPRAGIDLVNMAKVVAYLESRDFVLPDDVKFVFHAVCNHRLGENEAYQAEAILKNVAID